MGRKAKQPTDYEWSGEREEILLNWWEENELLYNMELKDYSNQIKKRRTYEEFAAKMGTTGKLSSELWKCTKRKKINTYKVDMGLGGMYV